MLLAFANESIYGKSLRIVCTFTHAEYFGQIIIAIISKVYKEIGLTRVCPATNTDNLLCVNPTLARWRLTQ